MEVKDNRLSDFVAGVGIATVFVGAVQDILSAGQDRGFWFPIALFLLVFIFYILDLVPSFKTFFSKNLPFWKGGFLWGMFFIAFVTLGIAIYGKNTERGLIADTIPQVSDLQNAIGLNTEKLDSLAKSVDQVDEKLDLQNESFGGQLLSKNPETHSDYIKNIYIYHKNNNNQKALEVAEQYLNGGGIYFVDFGEVMYQILYDLGKNPEEYLINYYNKSNEPNVLYTIYSRITLTKESSQMISDYIEKHPESIALNYLYYYDNISNHYSDLLLREVNSIIKSQRFFSSLNKSEIYRVFSGGILSNNSLNADAWLKKIRAIGDNFLDYDYNVILSELVTVKKNDEKLCVFKNNINNIIRLREENTEFIVYDESYARVLSGQANKFDYSLDNCNIAIPIEIDDKKIYFVSYVDNDGLEYKYWIITIEQGGNVFINFESL